MSVMLWQELSTAGELSTRGQDGKSTDVINLWRTIQDRQGITADVLSQAEGEAWLKYWHARILTVTPEKQPGQYKAILNTIGREIPTAPACVPGTHRVLLSEIRPTVPAGVPRGVFMSLAMYAIHGFCDGNGRLSRFLLGWENETVELPAIVTPVEMRKELMLGIYNSMWHGEIETLVNVLSKVHAHTERLLKKLN